MHSIRVQTRRFVAAAAILMAAVVPASAGAADKYIPEVTDSSTIVRLELERRQAVDDRYLPSATDTSTIVRRELEQRRATQERAEAPTSAGDSLGKDAVIGAAAALAVAGTGIAVAAGRRRRIMAT
jgi:hypothetical protein